MRDGALFCRSFRRVLIGAGVLLATFQAASTPPTPSLVTPADNDVIQTPLPYLWDSATAPNDDLVSYQLEVDEDGVFGSGTIVRYIEEPWATLGYEDGILDMHTYHWRVFAVDLWGASSPPSAVRSFMVSNCKGPKCAGAAALVIRVVDSLQPQQEILGAEFTLSPACPGMKQTSNNAGYYLLADLDGGVTYRLDVSKPGYAPYTSGSITIGEGNTVRLPDIGLELPPELPAPTGFTLYAVLSAILGSGAALLRRQTHK